MFDTLNLVDASWLFPRSDLLEKLQGKVLKSLVKEDKHGNYPQFNQVFNFKNDLSCCTDRYRIVYNGSLSGQNLTLDNCLDDLSDQQKSIVGSIKNLLSEPEFRFKVDFDREDVKYLKGFSKMINQVDVTRPITLDLSFDSLTFSYRSTDTDLVESVYTLPVKSNVDLDFTYSKVIIP